MRQKRQYALKNQKNGKPSSGKPPLKKQKLDSPQSVETRKGDTQTPETLQRDADELLDILAPRWNDKNPQPARIRELTEKEIKEGQEIARSI